jgi:hypothetical protein
MYRNKTSCGLHPKILLNTPKLHKWVLKILFLSWNNDGVPMAGVSFSSFIGIKVYTRIVRPSDPRVTRACLE